ncbi:gp29 [Alphaproteobacteria phage PhiJL001]|uniref:Gp29 n=1 Tax=Alphaproteobacteria phage PhiJL001 TaxID=2681607 RepID=Q5DN76_9CAUD|nr:gp29 [Alphaproteobacteria phage PhiJL001]AAT69505.1 gp29 [Alphaproteobacteria phage PhiJL001]
MSVDRFKDWLREAEPGDQIMYMQADYAGRRPEVARFFMDAAEEGKVFLFQKKVREGVYNYFARRVKPSTGKALKPWRED